MGVAPAAGFGRAGGPRGAAREGERGTRRVGDIIMSMLYCSPVIVFEESLTRYISTLSTRPVRHTETHIFLVL